MQPEQIGSLRRKIFRILYNLAIEDKHQVVLLMQTPIFSEFLNQSFTMFNFTVDKKLKNCALKESKSKFPTKIQDFYRVML